MSVKRPKERTVLGWTALLLVMPAALWLWTLAAQQGRRAGSGLAASPLQGTSQAQWKQPHRRAPAESLSILAVEDVGVATSVRGRRVPLHPGRPASAPAMPVHRVAVAGEAVSMSQEPAAQH
jgi:hypothetical protein